MLFYFKKRKKKKANSTMSLEFKENILFFNMKRVNRIKKSRNVFIHVTIKAYLYS